MSSLNSEYLKCALAFIWLSYLLMLFLGLMTNPRTSKRAMMARGWIPTITMAVGVVIFWIMPLNDYGSRTTTIFELIRLIFTVLANAFIFVYWLILLIRRRRYGE